MQLSTCQDYLILKIYGIDCDLSPAFLISHYRFYRMGSTHLDNKYWVLKFLNKKVNNFYILLLMKLAYLAHPNLIA